MPAERVAMRQMREIIRLKFSARVPTREIARRLGIAASTVRGTLRRFESAGLNWPLPSDMTDSKLEAALYSNRGTKQGHRRHAEPDWPAIHRELKRKHVTLLIIWDEYIAVNPGGYSYSRFCELYRAFEFRLPVTMRQTHVADQLHTLGLYGMAKAFAEIRASGEAESLGHSEWLGLLLDREASWRRDKRLAARLRYAKLRQQASIEDVDYRNPRGLDRALFQKLAEGNWIEAHDNLALTGPTGTGKSWLSSALGHKACRDNRSVLYHRVPKLFEHLALARGDGRHPRILRSLGRADLLILDDWGLEPLDAAARHDLLEILEERYGRRSTVITSQLPVDRWHEIIGDPTYADAILDRLVHNAHRIELAGESMRRTRGKQNQKA